MTSIKKFTEIVSKFLNPKPSIPSLGRWSSTIKEYEKNKTWFHDSCNQDNCYVDVFRNSVNINSDISKNI